MRNLTVLVLAGGLGKRMKSTIPKVLHKINDKSILSNILIKVNKLENVFIKVVVGKYHQLIKETLKDEIPNIESNLEYIFQEYSLGTGHALLCSIPNLRTLNGNILILNGVHHILVMSMCPFKYQHIISWFCKPFGDTPSQGLISHLLEPKRPEVTR